MPNFASDLIFLDALGVSGERLAVAATTAIFYPIISKALAISLNG